MFWAGVPRIIIEKIVAGQFAEMSALLSPTPFAMASPQTNSFSLEPGENNLVVTSQHRAARKIVNLPDWLQAWTNFQGIVVQAHPNRAGELVGYQHIILKAARTFRFSAVTQYDRSFRALAAMDPSIRWDQVATDLYTTTFDAQACSSFRVAEGTHNIDVFAASSQERCIL